MADKHSFANIVGNLVFFGVYWRAARQYLLWGAYPDVKTVVGVVVQS